MLRSRDLTAHYTDQGVVPRPLLLEIYPQYSSLWSFHNVTGSWGGEALLFVAAGVFALALLVGYKTRWATGLSWLMLTSLHNRSPFLQMGGDAYLRDLLFIACFLPLGGVWSLDSRRREGLPSGKAFSVWTVCFQLQIWLMYFTSGLLKSGRDWRQDGTAIYYALNVDLYATRLGKYMATALPQSRALTLAVTAFEIAVPFLLLTTSRRPKFRVTVLCGMATAHLMFAACLNLWMFSTMCIVPLSALLPAAFWEGKARVFVEGIRGYVDSLAAWAGRQYALTRKRMALSSALSSLPALASVALGSTLCALLVGLNLASLRSEIVVPQLWNEVASAIRFEQLWLMFAPDVMKESHWLEVSGDLEDGETLDLFGSESTQYAGELTEQTAPKALNNRWRSYVMSMDLVAADKSSKSLAQSLCERWNHSHDPLKRVSRVHLLAVKRTRVASGFITFPSRKHVLDWNCARRQIF